MIFDVLQHFNGKPIFDSLKVHVLEYDRIHNHAIQSLKASAKKKIIYG